jgi:hypothetical protein
MEVVCIHGSMVGDMKENGWKIIWKVSVYMYGTMVGNITANIKMIKNMVLEFIPGSMVVFMKVIGLEVNNMV